MGQWVSESTASLLSQYSDGEIGVVLEKGVICIVM